MNLKINYILILLVLTYLTTITVAETLDTSSGDVVAGTNKAFNRCLVRCCGEGVGLAGGNGEVVRRCVGIRKRSFSTLFSSCLVECCQKRRGGGGLGDSAVFGDGDGDDEEGEKEVEEEE